MQGQYTVDFAFDETVLLQAGYERAAAMRSGGNETVIVVEDTPTKNRPSNLASFALNAVYQALSLSFMAKPILPALHSISNASHF